MTKGEFVALCVRLAGIGILIQILPSLSQAATYYANLSSENFAEGWVAATVTACWLTAAILMIGFPFVVAGNWLHRHADQPLSFDWSRGTIEAVAFTLTGLFFCFRGIIDSLYWLWYYYSFRYASLSDGYDLSTVYQTYFTPQNQAGIFATAAEFTIGVWLLFGASGLRNLLLWLRQHHGPDVETSEVETEIRKSNSTLK